MLKAVLDTLEGLDEKYHDLYKEQGGKFYLQIEGITAHPQVVTLKSSMENAKKERNDAKKELDELKVKLGGDLPADWSMDEWLRLKAIEDDVDPADPEAKAKKKAKEDERLVQAKKNYEQQIANLTAKYSKDIADKDAKIGSLQNARAADKAQLELDEAMDKANIDPKFRPAVKALHANNLKNVVEDDENIRIFVETDLGEAKVSDYIASWSQSDDGKIYLAQPSGPGGNGNKLPNGVGGNNPFAKNSWNKTEQAAMRTDPAKMDRMAKAAGFKDGTTGLTATRPLA